MASLHPIAPETGSFPIVLPPARPSVEPNVPGKIDLTDRQATVAGGAGEGSGQSPHAAVVPSRSTRYLSLDLWRGAACLMLVFYHSTFYGDYSFRLSQPSTWTLGGLPLYLIRLCWVGVPIFFVISGYCISASVDSLSKRPHSIRDYFVRRFRRIYPPLWIMCGLAVLFTLAMSYWPAIHAGCSQLPRPLEFSLSQWIGNVLAFESWRHNVTGGEPTYLMSNTWTLCYEEQFYFLAGVMLAVSGRRFFSLAAILTLAVLGGRHLCMALQIGQQGFFWDGHWVLFAMGIFVYHTLNHRPSSRRWPAFAILAAGILYGAAFKIVGPDSFQKHLGEYFAVASAFSMLLLVVRPFDDWIVKQHLVWPLKWCGQRSYSIYLTHYLIVTVTSCFLAQQGFTSELLVATVVVPACLLITLPFAIAFYHLVERRFMNAPLDDKSGKRAGQSRAGAAC